MGRIGLRPAMTIAHAPAMAQIALWPHEKEGSNRPIVERDARHRENRLTKTCEMSMLGKQGVRGGWVP